MKTIQCKKKKKVKENKTADGSENVAAADDNAGKKNQMKKKVSC